MIIDYQRKWWYRVKTVGADGTKQIEVKWMPEAKDAYALWKSEGLIGPFPSELEAINDYLKAYRAEHGDDAPDPTPQPKPVTTFEEEWPKWEGGYEGSFCRLCKGDNCTATRQRLEITDGKVYIHVQTQCFDCGQELQGSRTEYALEELVKDHIHLSRYLATVNADLKTTRRMHKGAESNVDYWQRQFKQVEAERDAARAAQNQLRDELVAMDAQNKRLRFALERIAAVGSTGTIFRSDFEYAVQIAKDALLANQDK